MIRQFYLSIENAAWLFSGTFAAVETRVDLVKNDQADEYQHGELQEANYFQGYLLLAVILEAFVSLHEGQRAQAILTVI